MSSNRAIEDLWRQLKPGRDETYFSPSYARKQYKGVVEIQRDVEYKVNTVIDNEILSLYITLPPDFPQEKPQVRLVPRVKHAWVDHDMLVTGCPAINRFSVHSDLGTAVKEIINRFQKQPPQFITHQPNPAPYLHHMGQNSVLAKYDDPSVQADNITPPPTEMDVSSSSTPTANAPELLDGARTSPTSQLTGAGAHTYKAPAFPQPFASSAVAARLQTQAYQGIYRMPEFPPHFTHLHELSEETLRSILVNEEMLAKFLQNCDPLRKLQDDRNALCCENEQLAKNNLAKKPLIEDKKRIILEKFDQLNEARANFNRSVARQDELHRKYSSQALRDQLRIAAASSEVDAEKMADSFIAGNTDLDQFLKLYIAERRKNHYLKITEEKLHSGLIELPFS